MIAKRSTALARAVILIAGVLMPACNSTPTLAPTTISITNTPSPIPPTHTPLPPPTDTPEPLAALVNGEAITLAEYQAELSRFLASGTNLATQRDVTAETIVLNDLINQTLLAQAAAQAGFLLDENALQARIDQLTTQGNLEEWLQAGGYSSDGFRKALRRSISSAWMRDQITKDVPVTAEQIHAVQILLYNSDQANQVYTLLQGGQEFLTLAQRYDPLTGGELGWFPRNHLTESTLEEIAFSLEPGQFSSVIQTRLGYHILYVVEREPQRTLDWDARLFLQEQTLNQWLEQQRQNSQTEIFIP